VLRGSLDAVVRFGVRLLHELHTSREWITLLPITDVFQVAFAFASTPPRIADVSTDPHVGAAVGILLSVSQSSAVRVRIPVSQRAAVNVGIPASPVHVFQRYCYCDRNTESTSKSNPIELSNRNVFCGGKDC